MTFETILSRDREVGFMVGFAESKVLVAPREFRKFDYPAMADRLRPSCPALRHVFVVDGQPGEANPSWESFMDTPWEQRRDPAELAALRPDPNAVTLLMFTSGTTGEPKGVMHTHNTFVAAIEPLPSGRVVLRPGAAEFTFIEMQQFLNDKGMARQYWPERLEVMAEFPSTASGKIQKYRLREAIAGAS